MNDLTEIGPVQLMQVGFDPGAKFEMGASLPPGGSAGLVLIEHVWARGLKRAIRDAGGNSLGESFLTPETVAAIEPKLAAISRAVRATE
jgi:hypothetical protein